jgi:hypothetical protein
MLNERENFLRALSGEIPEYVPQYSILWGARPSIFMGSRVMGVGKDIFGVEWVSEGSAIKAALPKPGSFLLDDIRKWRDVIHFPDFSGVDWESMARKDLANYDPNLPRSGGTAVQGFFQAIMDFMGFTEGLIACVEEPEEVKALVNYLCDCYLSLADPFLQYYKPDFIMYADDIAAERNPFVSLDTFHDIFEPVWRRYITYFKDRGYLAVHHNCGHFEQFVDDIVDMGYNAWDPAQIASNDLVGIKKKYGGKLMLMGCLDPLPLLPQHNPTEAQCRAAMKETMDTFAPGGGFAFLPDLLDAHPFTPEVIAWVKDEYEKQKFNYYK